METSHDLGRPREGLWIAQPQKPRWVVPALAMVFVWQAPNIVLRIARHLVGEVASNIIEVFVYLTLLAIAIALALRERRARRMRLQDFVPVDGAFGDQFPVEVTVLAQGQRLGTDRGVLWFADGLMGFSGDASSFVLSASDVSVPALSIPEVNGPKGKTKLHPVVVVLQNAPRESQIAIGPLVGHEAAFRERLAAFMAAAERPEGERFWPPLVPYRAFDEPTAALS